MKAVIIKIHGDVQGVFYRYNAKKEAEKLKLSGWTKNENDGTVTIFAQGPVSDLKKLIEWSRQGSPMADVQKTEITEMDPIEDMEGFIIK